MADQDDSTTQIVIHPNPPNPFSSFFSNFLQLFNSPPPKSSPTLPKSDKTDVSLPDTTPKLTVVRFSHTPSQEVSPIKLESQDADRNTNPVLLWQNIKASFVSGNDTTADLDVQNIVELLRHAEVETETFTLCVLDLNILCSIALVKFSFGFQFQVYAVGGFFVLRWAWARWNERRGKNRPADEDDQPAQPAADN